MPNQVRKMAEAGPHDCETQKKDIDALIKTPLKKGDIWYLVDTKWFKQWKKYVGYDSWDTSFIGEDSANPGPIDNSQLLKEGTTDTLKEHLIDELDYMLVPEEAWDKLVSWYGLMEGQPTFPRKVIEQGMFMKHCKVEVYLMELKLCDNSNMEAVEVRHFSRADTVDSIEKAMRTLFQVSEEKEVRLWNKYMSNTYEQLGGKGPEHTVQDAGLYQGQVIVLEQKNDDGTWPRHANKVSTAASYSSQGSSFGAGGATGSSGSSFENSAGTYRSSNYYSSYDNNYRSSSSPGLCGLSNLGNTCFMNSAIQCMSNVPPLTEYMLQDRWQQELNHDNPLGMRGEIATSFAELTKNMWSGKYSYTVPRNFKVAVGRFQPQFSGYQQQDSQELMAFLLDGLHEDLNRIKNKPYVEVKDADGRLDQEVAKEAWENYLKRNDSIIVDIFHGLLKSTLICPTCHKVSVTFDPFCYLSLPLPIKKERQIEVFLVPQDPHSKPKQYKLTVPKMGVVADLCRALSKLTDITAEKMVVTDVYNHRFHKVFPPDEGLSHILDRDDIFVYEVPMNTAEESEMLIVPVYMREQRVRQTYNNYNNVSTQLFGQPLLVPVPKKNCTYQTLYNCVINKMARYVKVPSEGEEWWRTSSKDSSEEQDVGGDVEMSEEENTGSEKSTTSMQGNSDENIEDSSSSENSSLKDREVNGGQPPRLFSFHFVNSYGSTEVDSIKDDGKPLKFSNRSYLAIDWHPQAKHLFYDEKAAEEFETDESMNARPIQKRQAIQLTECLDLFTTTEKLGEQDPWYCPQCKKHRQATKKFDLWQLPRILVIHLKRFSYNRYWRDKLDTFVEYPTRGLCMKKWLINQNHNSAMYDLIAVSNHYGGMGGGHYTAYAKNKDDGQWYHFDDSSVSQASEDSVVTKAGYVLVYQQRDLAGGAESSSRSTHQVSAPSASGAAGSPERSDVFSANGRLDDDDMDVN